MATWVINGLDRDTGESRHFELEADDERAAIKSAADRNVAVSGARRIDNTARTIRQANETLDKGFDRAQKALGGPAVRTRELPKQCVYPAFMEWTVTIACGITVGLWLFAFTAPFVMAFAWGLLTGKPLPFTD